MSTTGAAASSGAGPPTRTPSFARGAGSGAGSPVTEIRIWISGFLPAAWIAAFGALPREVYRPSWLENPILMGDVRVLPLTLFVPTLSFLLMLGLVWIVYKTKPGLGMRAISKDIETSYLMGVSVNKVIALTFGIGSMLAAVGGIMLRKSFPPSMKISFSP